MRKLKLEVDALRVESFVVHPPAAEGGTVHAHLFEAPNESSRCDGAGWGSLFGTCAGCPTVGTCIGPTYCCPPTWRTCEWSCPLSCMPWDCGV